MPTSGLASRRYNLTSFGLLKYRHRMWHQSGFLLTKGCFEVVREISEYALLNLDPICELQDECELEELIDQLLYLHATACSKLSLEPAQFGSHLAELANKTSWGYFYGPPIQYKELLGSDGLLAHNATGQR